MFRELVWSSVNGRVKYNKAVFTYKALDDLTPSYISSIQKQMPVIHDLNLRPSDNGTLHIPFVRTGKAHFIVQTQVFTYKALNALTLSYISSLQKLMSVIRDLSLRSSDNGTLHTPFARTELW